jgi:hypothetical protein
MTPSVPAWARRVAPVAAICGSSALFAAQFLLLDFIVDDAFISFRYVDHLLDGQGLVFNPGEYVEGYSNFLWVMVLASFAAAGIEVEAAARSLGLVLGLATLVGVYLAGTRLLALGKTVAWAAPLLLAATGPWVFWAGAGLESPLFAALLLALWAGYSSPLALRPSGPAWLFLLAALLCLTRPEALALFPALLAGLLWHRRCRRLPVAAGAFLFLVLVGGHLAWRLGYYGEWLANPTYAKAGFTGSAIRRGLEYAWSFLGAEGIPFLAALGFLLYAAWVRLGPLLVLATLVLGYLVFIIAVGGDGLYQHRLLAHLAPLLALAVGLSLEALRALGSRVARALALALALGALAFLLWPTATDRFYLGQPRAFLKANEDAWAALGRSLARYAPPDLYLATNVAGKLPYYSRLRTLDMLGLCDRTVARAPLADLGVGYAGHERAAPEYVLGQAPDLIYLSVLDGAPLPLFTDPTRLAGTLARSALRGYAPLLLNPTFVERYRPALVATDFGYAASVLVRLGGPALRMPREVIRVLRWSFPLRSLETPAPELRAPPAAP